MSVERQEPAMAARPRSVRFNNHGGADSFPMVARCFEAQWRGLPEMERKWLLEEEFGQHSRDLSCAYPRPTGWEVMVLPLWWIEEEGFTGGNRINLMCIKYF